ncbi:hypothetical protein [Wolbachia endosymbiont of Folsomia candida]|uniref:hypothetical protein n=1 Tax=Wolbachia endosymbiont of Folsomia candida TaxID=169402 RepID=UPI000B3107B8|nr:hypothetical protein [Wolbachia endosymbiont of Folsomia candida]APR98429.1 hypothetical protein ASM33_04075 [Wolbachia endosymbiont of Folsomia candida]
MKYNKTRLCIAGTTGLGSAVALVSAASLLYIIKYKEIGMGILFVAPLMLSAAAVGINFAILSMAYLITGLTKCDKQKSNLSIGTVAAVASLANLGLAAHLCIAGGGLGFLAPVFGTLIVAGIAFAILSAVQFTKASKQEKKEVGSNMISVATQIPDTLEPHLQ